MGKIAVLKARARLLACVREFFAERGVLEVETPILAPTTGTDLHIDSFAVPVAVPVDDSAQAGGNPKHYYLQTSPEFAMKRLLAAGSGPIYQISKVFRAGESSPLHNPEFTMLEWYRPGFSMGQLMDEVAQLMVAALSIEFSGKDESFITSGQIPRFTYRDLFQEYLGLDPHKADMSQLIKTSREFFQTSESDGATSPAADASDLLQQLMNIVIEPRLPEFCFVYDYPAEQCALARVAADKSGAPVARRFELYGRGLELANGYDELIDAAEQRCRFEADLAQRRKQGRALYPIDENFLAALGNMPPCCGVALGLDRLLMLITGTGTIGDVISFTTDDS